VSKICTCFDGNAISNVVRGWLPSLRKVYGGDTVAFHLNLSGEALDRISGFDESVLIPPAVRTDRGIRNDPMFLVFSAWIDYFASLPDDEPVMIYDGADVGFQASIDPLIAEVSSGRNVFTMGIPRKIEDSPSTAVELRSLLGKEFNFVWPKMRGMPLLCTSLIAGQAGVLSRCFMGCGKYLLKASGSTWGSDQAALNYHAYLNPGLCRAVDRKWCFDLRYYPYRFNGKDVYVDGGGRVIPVVHSGGYNSEAILRGVMAPMGKTYLPPGKAPA
jgi:hypothetical protein